LASLATLPVGSLLQRVPRNLRERLALLDISRPSTETGGGTEVFPPHVRRPEDLVDLLQAREQRPQTEILPPSPRKEGDLVSLLQARKTSPEELVSLKQPGLKRDLVDVSGNEFKNPFGFQDANQERVVHASTWDKGNTYRMILEGTGDIFREFTVSRPDPNYIMEKIRRIERHWETAANQKQEWENRSDLVKEMTQRYGISPLKTGIHPEDSFEYSKINNIEKFNKMKKLWEQQPVESKIQETARKLNLAMLSKDFDKAKTLIETIKKNISQPTQGGGESLFHETDSESARLLTTASGDAMGLNVAIDKDLALGQTGKGVIIEFDKSKLLGDRGSLRGLEKPGSRLVGKEFRVVGGQFSPDAVKSITIKPNTKLSKLAKRGLQNRFTFKKQEDGSFIGTPKS